MDVRCIKLYRNNTEWVSNCQMQASVPRVIFLRTTPKFRKRKKIRPRLLRTEHKGHFAS